MRHGSLFSGIGGFDLASEWMGWENVFHCEWNEFGQKVLKYYWPKAITYHDITKTDFTIHRGTIDILTGGFPCQPYSMAGKRLGKEDERHLWPEMLRAIREIQPTWVVGENVLGLVNWNDGLVFHEVQADLEAQGYEVQPYVLPAASVNAPHKRDRVWFIAYSNNKGRDSGLRQVQGENGEISQWDNYAKPSDSSFQPNATNTSSIGLCKHGEGQRLFSETLGTSVGMGEENVTDTKSARTGKDIGRLRSLPNRHSDGIQDDANSKKQRLEGMRREKGGYSELCGGFYGIQDWQNFPTVSPICTRDDGISDRLDSITFSKWRNESIKAGGNAIVPQVVHQIFKAIEQYEITRHTQGT